MGDPAGVGPEICLHALANEQLAEECQLLVFGDAGVLNRCARELGLPAPKNVIAHGHSLTDICGPTVIDLNQINEQALVIGLRVGRMWPSQLCLHPSGYRCGASRQGRCGYDWPD